MRIHRGISLLGVFKHVVNCFQNTNFSEDSQASYIIGTSSTVVNCFQNTNFSEDSQATLPDHDTKLRCELLSEY